MSCCFYGSMCVCCVDDYEDNRKPDKRKLRRGRRQAARETFLYEWQWKEFGRKAIRKMKAIEKSMTQKEKAEKLKRECAERFAKQWSFGGEK